MSEQLLNGPDVVAALQETRRLVEWYQAGVDVARVLPTLATYLGHVGIGLTYWYIEAVPELLAHARTRLESPRLPGGVR